MIVNYLKHKFYNLLTTMIVLFIFVLSGAIFLTFLGFGLYGLSRILIYFRLGDFTYNRSMYDNPIILWQLYNLWVLHHICSRAFNGLF